MGDEEDEEQDEVDQSTVTFGEHAFQFEKFEQVRRASLLVRAHLS